MNPEYFEMEFRPGIVTSPSSETDLDLEYLRSELARVDVLLRRAVRRWQLASQDPADNFRGLYISDADADALLARPFGSNWGATQPLESAETLAFDQELALAEKRSRAIITATRESGQDLRLERLGQIFDLTAFDRNTLLICLAPALDLRYERLYGYLQDDVTRKQPSVNLILDLLCEPGSARFLCWDHFLGDAPLFKYHLLEPTPETRQNSLLNRTLLPDMTLVAWLLGHYQPRPEFNPRVHMVNADAHVDQHMQAVDLWPSLEPSVRAKPILVLYGPDQAMQHDSANQLAARLGRPLLRVDLGGLVSDGLDPGFSLRLVLRDARLTGALPLLLGWEAILEDGCSPIPEILSELCAFPDLAIVAGREKWQARDYLRQRRLVWVEFPVPAYTLRRELWAGCLEGEPLADEINIESLAGQFQLTSSQIIDARATARDTAGQEGRSLNNEDLFAAARAHSNPHLANLALKIPPRYTWTDIVLPQDTIYLLKEIVATVRGRPTVLDRWGVGAKLASSRGVTALFTGPPGTGKTMAAEVIAAELKLDLYKIDLSTVVSKYIGETEKNLERIFTEAETSNAILFFDEADALFGKRSEVRDSHDRYANIEISYLLQRMEAYDGVTILATNLGANLDEAFKRRLQFAVDFPFPEESDRLRIWRTLFPPDVPRAADINWELLAGRFRLAGGNIRNVIVNAAYLAASDGGQVNMAHLLHGTRRELQKMGRLVDEENLLEA
jgi:hypothetical protein